MNWLKKNRLKILIVVLILVVLFFIKVCRDNIIDVATINKSTIAGTNSALILEIPDSLDEESSISMLLHKPGPTAKFKLRVNDNLYQYYPLAVGNKWVYESLTYEYDNFLGEAILVKEISELTVKVDKIYEEEGVEYVELNRVSRIVDLKEVDEESGKVIRNLPLPKNEELIFNTTAVLEISDVSAKYLSPAYPGYIDSFPLKEGIIIDLNKLGNEHWESEYGSEALVWKRKKVDDYNINKKLTNCFSSYIYDLRGSSGSKNEIVFCEGVGPVKYVSELVKHINYSYYNNLIDYQVDK